MLIPQNTTHFDTDYVTLTPTTVAKVNTEQIIALFLDDPTHAVSVAQLAACINCHIDDLSHLIAVQWPTVLQLNTEQNLVLLHPALTQALQLRHNCLALGGELVPVARVSG